MHGQTDIFNRRVNLGIFIGVVLCLIFMGLFLFGYGTLKHNLEPGQVLYINGNKVSESSVKLRPGTYEVSVRSAKHTTTHQQMKVGLFQSKTLEPKLVERNPDELVGSVIGSYGLYGLPRLSSVEWFNNDTWLAARVGPGSPARIALSYDDGTWEVAYFTNTGYPSDLEKLPAEVRVYLQQLQSQEVQQ